MGQDREGLFDQGAGAAAGLRDQGSAGPPRDGEATVSRVPHASLVERAVAGLPGVVFERGWDDSGIAGNGTFAPGWVVMHHTAGMNNLRRIRPGGTYADVASAHFLVDRDGTIHVISASRAYHAGAGGPLKGVPTDQMNGHGWGIEIEDLGLGRTMTEVQMGAAAAVAAGLLREMRQPVTRCINHRTWAPRRKVDTRYSDKEWRKRIQEVGIVAWAVGKRKMVKTPIGKTIAVEGGRWVTVATIHLPKGSFACSLQVRMPRGVAAGEARLGRVGWGTAGPGEIDDTAQNPIAPASAIQRWRTPIDGHNIVGGGPLAYQVWLPKAAKPHALRVVAKAVRTS